MWMHQSLQNFSGKRCDLCIAKKFSFSTRFDVILQISQQNLECNQNTCLLTITSKDFRNRCIITSLQKNYSPLPSLMRFSSNQSVLLSLNAKESCYAAISKSCLFILIN